ncbi:MAG TPA: helix-turn-helix domain-containing protein [Planctomycetota bacterium]|nr:helix-turn-helix domain-containing protein [Planctomycetota bacterium]
MSDYLTPDEVDERLKLPRGKAKRLAKRGILPAVFLEGGKTIRFESAKLTAFLEASKATKKGGAK